MAPVRISTNILLAIAFCSRKELLGDPKSACQPSADYTFHITPTVHRTAPPANSRELVFSHGSMVPGVPLILGKKLSEISMSINLLLCTLKAPEITMFRNVPDTVLG